MVEFIFNSIKRGTQVVFAEPDEDLSENVRFQTRCPILFPCSTGGFAAHVVRALPHQDQQLPLPGGMMQPGTNDQRGEDCGSFTLNSREGERAHSQ